MDYEHPETYGGRTVYPIVPDEISLGRAIGRNVRGIAGQLLVDSQFKFDTIANEFVIALPGISGADLYTAAERFRRRIRELVVTVSHGHGTATVSGLTASIGGALYPHTTADESSPANGTTTVDELLRAADSACYKAKRQGRDRVELVPHTLREHRLAQGPVSQLDR